MPGRRRGWWLLAVVVLAAAAVAGWFLWPRAGPPRPAAEQLAAAWSRGEIAAAPFDEDAPDDLADRYEELTADLDADPPRVTVVEVPEDEDGSGSVEAALAVAWDLGNDTTWSYRTKAGLRLVERTWRIVWDPALVHPRLEEGVSLGRERLRPDRGDVLAADGTPLVTERPVVRVGIQPSRVRDLGALTATLERVLEIDGRGLAERVRDAPPDVFVPVITLREDHYRSVRGDIHDLPGTVFRTDELPLAPTRDFARALLGRAGPVTAEVLEANRDRYEQGDVVGLSGLQARYDERLFGTPGVRVALTGEDPPEDPVLFETGASPGEDVTVTLDEAVQRAADGAVEATEFATALVAIRIPDGQVLAAANSSEAGAFNLAFEAQVPPGSTFKLVTTAALLEQGLGVDDPVPCPPATTIEGRRITNADDQGLGRIPFRTALVRSCNTAFARLSQRLDPDRLAATASRFGLGRPLTVGVDAFGGEVPVPEGPLDLAVTAIGQGRTLVSPLAMAGVAATVARGRYRAPELVLTPAPSEAGAAGQRRPAPLPPRIARTLRELTGLVVTQGTGTAAAGVPDPPVHGKTGTAEYGEERPRRTHAWFVGYRGGLAFAVLVAETPGAEGGEAAAPVAAAFLEALDEG